MALDLMPVSTEAPRCSEFARSIDVLPPGSGLFLERVVLLGVPLPWPKPALSHEMLAPFAPLFTASSVATRLFAMEPTTDGIEVEVYDRSGATTVARRWELADQGGLAPLMQAIADAGRTELDAIAVDGVPPGQDMAPVLPTFLVCTQGSHDLCCGTSGVALADQIERERARYVVRRVSHTGGHRFSPTFLALPSGRMWAFADLDLVDRVASDRASSGDFQRHARGWWGAKVGPAQVAENAIRVEQPERASEVASVEVRAADEAASSSSFVVGIGDATWQVDVEVARTIPSIACEAPGGLPAKPGREFRWSIAQR